MNWPHSCQCIGMSRIRTQIGTKPPIRWTGILFSLLLMSASTWNVPGTKAQSASASSSREQAKSKLGTDENPATSVQKTETPITVQAEENKLGLQTIRNIAR